MSGLRQATNPTWFVAEGEGCAQSLRSLRFPRFRQGRRTNFPPHVGKGSHPVEYFYDRATGLPGEAFALPGGERGIRTLDPVISGIHDFQSCPFGLSGISP